MSDKKYDALVFIGRFQPFHNGHQAVIGKALTLADKVIVGVGSAFNARSSRNPFTYEERSKVITKTYAQECEEEKLIVSPLRDVPYNDFTWMSRVQKLVRDNVPVGGKVGIIGCSKDHTSYYLNIFPGWANESVEPVCPYLHPANDTLNATDIREIYWHYGAIKPPAQEDSPEISKLVPEATLKFLQEFERTMTHRDMSEEFYFILRYKKSVNQYTRIEHTVDAVVTRGDHILIIERGWHPGKNLLALPGGFVEAHEKLEDAMIRELCEETNINVSDEILRYCIKNSKTYDEPNRSSRGRIITQAFHICLSDKKPLPEIKGGDDAARAVWMRVGDLTMNNMYEDHYFIIEDILGLPVKQPC